MYRVYVEEGKDRLNLPIVEAYLFRRRDDPGAFYSRRKVSVSYLVVPVYCYYYSFTKYDII